MENDDSKEGQVKPIEFVYVAPILQSSSESDVSLEEFIPDFVPLKEKLYKEGLYDPGSGEICAKYIAASASSVLRHPYYNYPAILDPGIYEALLYPESIKKYEEDGQELYLDLCKEMRIIPIRIFYKGLLTEEIDLKYYGVNPVGVRAMCKALANNQTVTRLDLTSNYLDHIDASYHIGRLLRDNKVIMELVLSGCNIGPKFVRRLLNLLSTRALDLLDLSENKIRDEGFPFLTEQIMMGAVIRRLNLRHNDLTSDSLILLAEALDFHDFTTHLDLSWNNFYDTQGVIPLIRSLRRSNVLVELNLSYTSLCVGVEIGGLLRIETLKVLDLSNNKLTTNATKVIAKSMSYATSLLILDLSCNPLNPLDALELLCSLKSPDVRLTELRMDCIVVNKKFAEKLEEIKRLTFRKGTLVTHGYILGNYTLELADIKAIYLKQLVRLTSRKKGAADILVWILDEMQAGKQILEIAEFQRFTKRAGVMIDDEFMMGLSKCFPGPKSDAKIRPFNLELMADYIHRIYPQKKPTPIQTTPPEPVPEIIPNITKKKKK